MFIYSYVDTKWLNHLANLSITIILFFVLSSSGSQHENQMKLVLENLDRISYFVTWPANKEMNDEYVIAVDGGADYLNSVRKYYENHTFKGKRAKIIDANDNCDPASLQVLILASEKSVIDFEKFRNKPILIVSTPECMCKNEATIQFLQNDSKMPFMVNLKVVRASGLQISHLLLKEVTVIQ